MNVWLNSKRKLRKQRLPGHCIYWSEYVIWTGIGFLPRLFRGFFWMQLWHMSKYSMNCVVLWAAKKVVFANCNVFLLTLLWNWFQSHGRFLQESFMWDCIFSALSTDYICIYIYSCMVLYSNTTPNLGKKLKKLWFFTRISFYMSVFGHESL